MTTRGILKNLTVAGAIAFVLVTVLTLAARVVAASAGLVAELGERLSDAGAAACADIVDHAGAGRAASSGSAVVAVRTHDVPAWSV